MGKKHQSLWPCFRLNHSARWESALRKAQPGRWADPLGDAIKAARAWCRERGGGGDGDAAEKEPLVAVTVDRSASRDDNAEG